jgi:predicted Zn-dependent protease
MKQSYLWILAVALLALAGCYTVPETGRSSFVLIPPSQEIAMGAQSFAEMRKTEPVSNDPRANARVQRVGHRIATAVGDALPGAQWEFVVFESKDVNAFALPGGKVGVYTGLLQLAESDDELAIVMGHEIAHVTARHGAERMTEALAIAAGGALVGVAADKYAGENKEAFATAYGLGTNLALALPHSRRGESEADYIGLRYAAKAGYDPRSAVTFWQKMARQKEAAGGGQTPAFLSTHPSDAQRIAELQKQVPGVLPLYETARAKYPVDGETDADQRVIGAEQRVIGQ